MDDKEEKVHRDKIRKVMMNMELHDMIRESVL